VYVLGAAVQKEGAKQSRLQTIASIVNTMMGTTIVALPYGMAATGVSMGIAITCLMGSLACFTCLLLVQYGKGGAEFSSVVAGYLGKYPQLLAWALSTAVIAGAAIVYHILMQESLYQLVQTVLTASGHGGETWWKHAYAALVPLVLYPICNFKDLSALVKVNSLGFLFLWYTILFMVYHGAKALTLGNDLAYSWQPPATAYSDAGLLNVNLGGTANFGPLAGMMMLSFFIHNVIQPILKNAQPATQRTDIVIASVLSYCRTVPCCAMLSYTTHPSPPHSAAQVHHCWHAVCGCGCGRLHWVCQRAHRL